MTSEKDSKVAMLCGLLLRGAFQIFCKYSQKTGNIGEYRDTSLIFPTRSSKQYGRCSKGATTNNMALYDNNSIVAVYLCISQEQS
ncbi:hypothetical protein KsCSTR_42930 [Candidatus Kuenenia stuttgartiensis]|uniref:Uncharacterized protein n=1 Tax=Kuenenia stuttgartiensis TaxID=174633 RepID=Q1PX92_KUEST|nr:hypothetical protein KsCSTR_42930 [Candidatus Kuenenia stuttgartiensis]CAJ71837.1 unknown protein [Candidatus Kuenenia stuttgartiensis]